MKRVTPYVTCRCGAGAACIGTNNGANGPPDPEQASSRATTLNRCEVASQRPLQQAHVTNAYVMFKRKAPLSRCNSNCIARQTSSQRASTSSSPALSSSLGARTGRFARSRFCSAAATAVRSFGK